MDPIRACWQQERERPCLRVELRPGEVFLFPYQHFVGARLSRLEGVESLVISFSSHRVILQGRHFEGIVTALQQFAVDWITQTPSRYQQLVEEASAIIEKLEVEEA